MDHPVRLLLVSGSLRATSTNTAVLRTALAVAPDDVIGAQYDGLDRLPHFNPDDDILPLRPEADALRRAVRRVDAVLISTPEYAGALPGSFKNLLDWLIGDDQPGSIYGKPVAWINASPRTAAGAHDELRRVLGYASAHIVEPACVHVAVTGAMVGPDGLVADAAARETIRGVVAALTDHVRQPQTA